MVEEVLRSWNPWWAQEKVPDRLVGTPREALAKLSKPWEARHIRDIVGIRRCGKTTLMYQLVDRWFAEATYQPTQVALLNFDDPAIFETDLDTLLDALSSLQPDVRCLLLDEVQEREGWERWVRRLYDTRAFDRIVVTGSSSQLLSGELARVLTGRHVTVPLYPMSFREVLAHKGIQDLDDLEELYGTRRVILNELRMYLERGGFPEAVDLPAEESREVFTLLFNDILARDVVARHNAEAVHVRHLATVLLKNSGSPFTLRRLANATGMAVDTVKKYTAYLEEAFLFLSVPVFSWKPAQQMMGIKKYYCVDPGLVHMMGLGRSGDKGRTMEGVVFLELLRRGARLHHWRDKKQREVDFVVQDDTGVRELVQVAYTLEAAGTRKREFTALRAAMSEFDLDEATIVTWAGGEDVELEEGRVRLVSLWRFLLQPRPWQRGP